MNITRANETYAGSSTRLDSPELLLRAFCQLYDLVLRSTTVLYVG
jgi:hypothetical protein